MSQRVMMPASIARACPRRRCRRAHPSGVWSARSGFGWIEGGPGHETAPFLVSPLCCAHGLAGLRPAGSRLHRKRVAEESDSSTPRRRSSRRLRAGFQPHRRRAIWPGCAQCGGGGLVPSDRVVVAVAGPPALASARFDAVAAALLPYGIVATPAPVAVGPERGRDPARALSRHLAALPQLEQAGRRRRRFHKHARHSNFGCADPVNLGLMVASPADLVEARPVALTEGTARRRGGERYLTDKVQLPIAANIGPIAAPTSQPRGAAAGG